MKLPKRQFTLCLLGILACLTLLIGCGTRQDQITKKDIAHAERLLDLQFSNAERDSMLADVQENRDSYNHIRKVALDNAVPPAVTFNPIPVGMTLPTGTSQVNWSDYRGTRLPENDTELAFYSLGQLAALLRTRQISSVKLTTFFLRRLKTYDPKLKCVITLTEETALEQARQADAEIAAGRYRGPLHGIPCGVKDLLAMKGYKTTWGAAPFKDQVIDQDAAVIRKLCEAGAVITAKLTMGALAWGDVWFGGKTRNPWDVSKGSSGSSAGPASAVAAGLLPFAIGTETWGSIVSPCTVCGCSGLRPTYGRVSRAGAMALSWSMDKIGPICRTVEDCAMVFNAIYGPDGEDQTVYDVPFRYSPEIDLGSLKIGYLKDDFAADYDFHKNDSLALAMLKGMGANLVPITLPDLPVRDISFILSAEAAAAFDVLTRSNRDDLLVRQMKNAWPNVFRTHRFVPAVEYINANRIRFLLVQQMAKLMEQVDLYLAPSWQGDNLLMNNLSGHPCVVLPNGFSNDGTPTSFVFVGRLFDEGTILAVAKAYQDATGFQEKHPNLKF